MLSVVGFIERRLERATVRFAAVAVLGVSLVLLAVSVITTVRGRTVFGPSLGADYAAFYTAGTILNEYPSDRLYDLQLQDRLYHGLFPQVSAGEILPYANPPFLAELFRPLARLTYGQSFLIWLMISLGFYVAGVLLLLNTLENIRDADRGLILLLALSFEPFVMECWLGGQLSSIGLFLVAAAVRFDLRGRYLASGLVLGCCLYKPTLLPLLLPMLVISRRWNTVAGFILTATALAAMSLWLVGFQTCSDYIHLMFGYAGAATGSASIFRLWKFVDLNTFFKLLPGVSASLARWLVVTLGLVALPMLARFWWTMDRSADRHRLTWAATIACTLVLNIYVGIYDSVLVVLAVMLTLDALYRARTDIPAAFRWVLLVLYATPWFSQPLARNVGLQVYSIVLCVAAFYPLWLAAQSGRLRCVTNASTAASPAQG